MNEISVIGGHSLHVHVVESAHRQKGRFVTFDTRAAAHNSEIVDVIPG
jgi:hypothetical protein